MRRMGFVLLAVTLLVVSLLLAACGSSASNAGASNISTNNTQQTTTSQPASSSTSGNTDKQVQNAIQSLDGAQNDVNNADSTATTESGSAPQP